MLCQVPCWTLRLLPLLTWGSQLDGEDGGVNRPLCLSDQSCGPGSVRAPRMEQCPLARERWGWPEGQGCFLEWVTLWLDLQE